MLLSLTNAEAQAVLWALATAKPAADEAFPRSCLVAQIEGVSERLASELSYREAQDATRTACVATAGREGD